MEAYLDNSATTRCYDSVTDIMLQTMLSDYGNPSSMHRKGVKAEQYIKNATAEIAKAIKVQEKEIYYTSGGTESNNWALIGTARANCRSGKHIITTAIEHPAVSAPVKHLEEDGFEVTILPVDRLGVAAAEDLRKALRPDTILVSTIYVNNEIGSVQPVAEIGRLIKEYNPNIVYHVDAIQAFGKYRIYPKKFNIDLLSVSAHKIHGPKGVGFLYINENVKIAPLLLGGGQQQNMRSGTDNVTGIAGLGEAVKRIYQNYEVKIETMRQLKQYFIKELSAFEDVTVHGGIPGNDAPHIISVSFGKIRSEVQLHTLEDRSIYVSAGSACSTHKRTGSPTLLAIHASKEQMESAVRISLSENTEKEELDYCVDTLKEVVPMLRRFVRH